MKQILAAACSRNVWRGRVAGSVEDTGRLWGIKDRILKRVIFLYAFAKSGKANISAKEEAALSLVAEAFFSATDSQINRLLAEGSIWEVQQ